MSDDRLQELENKLEAVVKKNDYLERQTEWLEEQLDERESEIVTLRQRVDALEESTELLEQIESNSAGKPTERAALLLQTLYQRAERGDGTASFDVEAALDVLRLDRDKRTLMYHTFERAEEMVGETDAVRYRKEGRTSEKNSRLILDLGRGELPQKAAGVELKTQSD
jgi:chromosome segregation ATPase